MKPITAVLFDLDGTLLDTAPDITYVINLIRQEQRLSELPLSVIRPILNLGSRAMVKRAFDMDENHPEFNAFREKILTLYQQHLANSTQLFPNIEKVLNYLEERYIPWGIVTNKLTKHTTSLLKALKLDKRSGCTICGDTLATAKPDPEPVLHACRLLKHSPANCLFVGDAATDVLASKAAGTQSLVALYGYINTGEENPEDWQADGYVNEPIEIIDWIEGRLKN